MATKNSKIEKIKKRKEELSKRGGGKYQYFIFKEGTVRMRPLPTPEDEDIGIEVITFYLGKELGGIISPATFGEPCGLMEKYEKLSNSKDEDDQNLASTMKPKKRMMVPHIKYKDEKGTQVDEDAGAKLALLTNNQYQDLTDLFLDEENGDMTDPKKGYDIKYKRTGKGQFDTEYSLLTCKSTPLPKKYNKIYSPEEMVRAIMPTYEDTVSLAKKFLKLDTKESSKGKEGKDKSSVKKKKKKKDL
jgi:hypothetical protein